MSLPLKHVLEVLVRSKSAESGPPLGTVLGNLGVNAIKFCKDFNDFSQDLPSYFKLRVTISIFEDRSFSFSVKGPTTGYIISLLRFDRTIKKSGHNFLEHCISLPSVIQLSLFKFPHLALKRSLPIIMGSVVSAGLNILI
jgi:large subunit ribosomal protein L11